MINRSTIATSNCSSSSEQIVECSILSDEAGLSQQRSVRFQNDLASQLQLHQGDMSRYSNVQIAYSSQYPPSDRSQCSTVGLSGSHDPNTTNPEQSVSNEPERLQYCRSVTSYSNIQLSQRHLFLCLSHENLIQTK